MSVLVMIPLLPRAQSIHDIVLCREYLQKIAGPDKEVDIFEEIFVRLATGEKPAESFRKLCEDSKSYPRKSLRSQPPPETISVPRVD